jgi:hypothetical protein
VVQVNINLTPLKFMLMPDKILIIPCKKYMARYLYSKFEANEKNPLTLERNSNVHLILKSILSSNYKREEKRKSFEKYDFLLRIKINSNIYRHGYRLSRASVSTFNVFMRNQIFDEFRNKMRDNYGSGDSKENLAIEFLNQYNITEDELSVDTILRDERRNSLLTS